MVQVRTKVQHIPDAHYFTCLLLMFLGYTVCRPRIENVQINIYVDIFQKRLHACTINK